MVWGFTPLLMGCPKKLLPHENRVIGVRHVSGHVGLPGCVYNQIMCMWCHYPSFESSNSESPYPCLRLKGPGDQGVLTSVTSDPCRAAPVKGDSDVGALSRTAR